VNRKELIEQEYKKLTTKEKKLLHDMFKGHELDFSEQYNKLRLALFTHIPPSPEEFLDHRNGYISYHTENGLYDHVRRDFLAAMNPNSNYPVISIYGSTRTGKSVLARLFILYTLIYVNYLRDPHLYFKINKMSKISLWLLSFKDDKTKELLLDPLLILLDDSEKFRREHFEKSVYVKGVDDDGIISFSEAGKFGAISTPKLKIATGKDPSSIVGSDIVAGVISELSFFKKYAPGFTDETAKEVFTKLRARIRNTIGESSFPCWTYIDTSANDSDSPLESYILNELKNNPRFFFRHYCLWEVRPHLFPIWNNDRTKTFKLCVGDGSHAAKVFHAEHEWSDYPPNLLIDVPIDLYDLFINDLQNQIRDTAGRPTTGESKFIQVNSLIDRIFIDTLLNEEGGIVADASRPPEKLLWNELYLKYFVDYEDGKRRFLKRAPREIRYAGVDLAYAIKGDVQGLAIGHKEWSRVLNQVVYVGDMVFPLLPGEQGINIDAVGHFIKDLSDVGVVFEKVVFDTFQSEPMSQFLTRYGIPNEKQSVDGTLYPYSTFYSLLLGNQIKAGKNVFLKNNLKSLYRTTNEKGIEKIDHSKGKIEYKYSGDWEHSECGLNAKDVSDAFCNWVYAASQDNFLPSTCFEDENERILRLTQKTVDPEITKQFTKSNFKKLIAVY